MTVSRSRLLLIPAMIFCLALAAVAQDGEHDKKEQGFRFRFVGPEIGNRVASIAGVPGDPNTYYAGAA